MKEAINAEAKLQQLFKGTLTETLRALLSAGNLLTHSQARQIRAELCINRAYQSLPALRCCPFTIRTKAHLLNLEVPCRRRDTEECARPWYVPLMR